MLLNPTLEKLQALKLTGISEALDEQLCSPDIDQLTFEERLGVMVDREITARDNYLEKHRKRGIHRIPRTWPLQVASPCSADHESNTYLKQSRLCTYDLNSGFKLQFTF